MKNKKKSVLVIDDYEDLREVLVDYLLCLDFLVDEASDGLEALEMIKGKLYDIVITDYHMPKMNGPEFIIEAIRLGNEETDYYLSTGDSGEIRMLPIKKIIKGVIEKPFSVDSLRRIIV